MNPALYTDLYQLTMIASYYAQGNTHPAIFEGFIRRLPFERNFLMAAGLESLLTYLESLHFSQAHIDWLRQTGRFSEDFLQILAHFQFTGDVDALPEGCLFFPPVPMIRVRANLPEAQFIESYLLNCLHYPTLVASKAARCVLAAPKAQLVDFGFRRAHSIEAGVIAARAAYIAGFAGTATVEAGATHAVPTFGTMAHSYVQAHVHEFDAFADFAKTHPDNIVLLLDTYDTLKAAQYVVTLAHRLAGQGINIKGVRIDSGDLGALSQAVRAIFDKANLQKIKIMASGDLDEYRLAALQAAGAPIDSYGVGTRVVTSNDAPYLDIAYKLQWINGRYTYKLSPAKTTLLGIKQIVRHYDNQGKMQADTLCLADECQPDEGLLIPVMRRGKRVKAAESLASMRARAEAEYQSLPDALKTLTPPETAYRVHLSSALQQLQQKKA